MGPQPEDLAPKISCREDMADFIDALSVDAIEYASQWENLQIFDMLESMAAWLRDTAENDGVSQPVLDDAAWQFVAHLLLAGKHYE